jgi:protein SCO1/2
MTDLSRRTILAGCALGPVAGVTLARGSAPAPKSSRDEIRERYFPNVPLVNQDGKTVRLYDDLIKGKIVTINFMYTHCEGVCPLITTNLRRVQKLLGARVGRDIFMYSFSLKPDEDTPPVLKEYARVHGVAPGWQFLTGTPENLELLRRKLGFTDPDPAVDADKENHIGNVRYGNEPLQVWAACPGLATPVSIAKSISWVDWADGDRRKVS